MRETVVGGKYRIEDRLGEGGMGTVWSAEHTETGRRVALKLLAPHAKSAEAVLRFSREARAASAAGGDHVVQVLDAGSDPAHGPFLVLELLDGEDASALLERLGPLRPPTALRIVHQALEGLARVHEAGIVHRDIKPANLFLARSAGRRVVKILDFGIAKLLSPDETSRAADLTGTGAMLGSPKYMSPEQVQGLRTLDHRADLWSLGVVLYKLLAGRTPHEDVETQGQLLVAICTVPAPPIREVAPWVRSRCAAVVERALALDPEERYADASAMLEAVRDALDGADPTLDEAALVPLDDADRLLAPASIRKPAGAAPVSPETAGGVASQPRPARASSLRAGWVLGALALAGAGVLALRSAGPALGPGPAAGTSASTPEAPASTETVATTASATAAAAEIRDAIVLVPRGARVEVDAVATDAPGGQLRVRGSLGTVHRVRVSLGPRVREQDVVIAEAGAVPAEIALPSAPAARSVQAPAGELDVQWPGSKDPRPAPR